MTVLVGVLVGLVAIELLALGGYGLYRLGRRAPAVVEPLPAAPTAVEADPPSEGSWLQGLLLEVVIVHTIAGLSYEGLLVLTEDKGLMMRNPKLLDDKRSPVPMAGELWIFREKIEGVQTKPLELTELPAAS